MNAVLRSLLVAILLTSWVCGVATAGPWNYGVRMGANAGSIHGDFADISDPKTRIAFDGGVFASYDLNATLALQTEINYVNKGATFEAVATDPGGNPIGEADVDLKLHYVEIPLLVKATFHPWGATGMAPYLIGGPTFSFAAGGEVDADVDDADSDIGDDMMPLLAGVTGGLGVRFPTQLIGLAAEARYRTDFDDLWDVSDNLESINHGVSFTLVFSR